MSRREGVPILRGHNVKMTALSHHGGLGLTFSRSTNPWYAEQIQHVLRFLHHLGE